MMNVLLYANSLVINTISSVLGDTMFWWHILLIAFGGIFLLGIMFLLIAAIHIRRKKLKREKRKAKREGYVFWNDK